LQRPISAWYLQAMRNEPAVSQLDDIAPVADWSEITLTPRCNQRCFFCYEDPRNNATEPDFEQIQGMLRETAKHADQVVFCGREVLLRKDVLEIVAYAHALGLRSVVFTNGQQLARPGFVEQLVNAGCASVAVSFHFPDAETFALGARVSPKMFERTLEGLRCVRDWNLQHPDRPLPISTESDMFTLNAGRLIDMRDTLVAALRGAPWRMRLASLLPVRSYDIGLVHVLDDLSERAKEVTEFVRTQPADVPLGFVKVPLCMLPPGEEHRSLDVQYVYEGTVLTFNHVDAAQMTLDTFSPSAGRDLAKVLRRHPYRWLCRSCHLAPMCRVERVDWNEAGFAPTRGQRPIPYRPDSAPPALADKLGLPVRNTSATDVFSRLGSPSEAAARIAVVANLMQQELFPEEEILAALAESQEGLPVLVDAWAEAAPLLVIEMALGNERLRLHLQPPTSGEGAANLDSLVGYLNVQPLDDKPELLLACLRRLAALDLPAIEKWQQDNWFGQREAALCQAAWQRFGERLWPNVGTLGSFRTESLRLTGQDCLSLQLRHRCGASARLNVRWIQTTQEVPRTLDVELRLDDPDNQMPQVELDDLITQVGARLPRVAPPLGCALRIVVPAADGAYRFQIAPFDAKQPHFRRAGKLVLTYEHPHMDAQAAACARVLLAGMTHMQAHPPSPASLAAWRNIVRKLARQAGVSVTGWQVGLREA